MPCDFPDPHAIFANEYKTSVFIKNVIKAPNILVGDFSYYDDALNDPRDFEKNCVLFNYPIFGDKLIIGKFCQIAQGCNFIMGPANHRLGTASTYPFNVMGKLWSKVTAPHLSELPHKGDLILGNDVWLGRHCVVMPGIKIGDGCIVAAHSVVTHNLPPYSICGGNPCQVIKKRFDEELIALLLEFKWWDLTPKDLVDIIPLLCDFDLKKVKEELKRRLLK